MLRQILLACFYVGSMVSYAQQMSKILVFSKTTGFRHDNIEVGVEALKKLGKENHFLVDHSEDATLFTTSNLRQYQAVVFLSTTGTIFNNDQKTAFMKYIQSGNGFVGIHAASDTEYEWPWYGKMVGAYFMSHPEIQNADIHVIERKHLSTEHLPTKWTRKDEWYDFKNLNKDVEILMMLDEKSYRGGKMGEHHPVSWYHEYDGGRAFYTALGHTKESFQEEKFLRHILGGIQYALGAKKQYQRTNKKEL